MPLAAKSTPAELWSAVINKTTNQPYKGIERCNDIDAFSEQEPELSDLIQEKMEEWVKSDPASEEKIRDFKQGFQYKHTDGFTYKLVKFKDGTLALSRTKPFAGGGGYRKGGGFTFMRTETFKVGGLDVVGETINNQGPGDSWKTTFLYTDKKGKDIFQMENQRPYSPNAAAASSTTPEKKEAAEEEADEESEDEQ